jgi:hypothetical protein
MFSKRDTYRAELRPLLWAALQPSDSTTDRFDAAAMSTLAEYLTAHSALPGPRGNLELAHAFADEVGALSRTAETGSAELLPALLHDLIKRYPPESFGGDPASPQQMPQFCGAVAYGEWAGVGGRIEDGVSELLEQAESPLWRIREAAAMGLQRMLGCNWELTLRELRGRPAEATPYQWRALVAGVAEPALLTDTSRAAEALALGRAALWYLRDRPAGERRTEPVRTLRQALGYALSVLAAAAPDAGFALLHDALSMTDDDVTWVVRENLGKKRLARWPEQVADLRSRLG